MALILLILLLQYQTRVPVCLVKSGPNSEDMSTNVWSDQVDEYFKQYPGSYCGTCGSATACP